MSKKVKGQKVDLGLFNGPVSSDILSRLPSAPSGEPRPDDGRRGGRGFDRDGGGRGGGRRDEGGWGGAGGGRDGGGGFADGDDNWGRRSGGGGGRGGGGFGGDRGGYGGDRGGGGGGYGGDRGGGGGGYGGDRGGYGGESMQRPDHMRLNLVPRANASPASAFPPPGGEAGTGAAAAEVDKFNKAFKSSDARTGGAGARSNFGGAEGGGFGGRGGEGGGFGGGRGGGGGDARGGFGGGGYGGGDARGGGYGRGNDFDSDPRFARFGGGGGPGGFGMGAGGGYGRNAPEIGSTGPPITVFLGKSEEQLKAEEETKAAKAAKAAAREEAARKEKEAKEAAAAAKEAEDIARKEAEAVAANVASAVLATGLKGDPLVEHLTGLSVKPTGAALVTEILSKEESDPTSVKWCGLAEYGAAVAYLVKNKPKEQMRTLYAIQIHFNKHKFPKIDVKGSKRAVFDILFQLLYKYEIIEDYGFLAWADDDEEVPGRVTAIVQTTEFMRVLTDVEEVEINEDDEVDAPQETVM